MRNYLSSGTMNVKLKWCCFLLIILLTSYFVKGEENDVSDASPTNPTNYEDNPENILHQRNVEQNDNLCSSGKDHDVRKNIEEIIRVVVRDSLASRPELVTEAEYDVHRDIQQTADEMILQLTLGARRITDKIDSTLKLQNILQSIEKTNSRYTAMENDSQNCISNHQFQIQEINRIKQINELVEAIAQLTTNTKQLTDTVSSASKEQQASMEVTNSRLVELENVTKLEEQNIENLLNITEKVQESVVKLTHELEGVITNATEPADDAGVIRSLCSVRVPSSVRVQYGTWKEGQAPERDDLDTYMALKTGCTYTSLPPEVNHAVPAASFDGRLLEWRVAVRARDSVDFGLSWPGAGYSLFVGQKMNTISVLRQWSPEQLWELSTPAVLSADRYVPFYIKIYDGTLFIGNECDSKPYFTRNITIEQGNQVDRLFKSWSTYGAKYLYDCPSYVEDRSGN